MPKHTKRVRSDAELEANRQNQRAKYEVKRLARLEEEKYEAKERVKGVDCSPASPLNEMEMAKKISGRPRKTIPLSLPEPGAQPRLPCSTPFCVVCAVSLSLSLFLCLICGLS